MNSERFPIYTVGHSAHPRELFVRLLLQHDIDTVVDVRSSPYSRRAPQFNRNQMKEWLSEVEIRYSFAGKVLGGRPDNPSLYHQGQVRYDRIAVIDAFIDALRRLVLASRDSRVALMCAEANPIECHRFLLIGRALHERWIDVAHILPTGKLESHADGERRLLIATGLAQPGFFEESGAALQEAYAIQASRFAFMTPSLSDNTINADRSR